MASPPKYSGNIHNEAEKRIKHILDVLTDRTVARVVLVGEPGIGKTWIARKVCDRAVREGIRFNLSLWFYLNKKYDQRDLCQSVAFQLNLVSFDRRLTHDDFDDDQEEEHDFDLAKFKQMISDELKGKTFLLVLDDEGSMMELNDIISHLRSLLPRDHETSYKVLITRGHNIRQSAPDEKIINIEPLSVVESVFLLKERIPERVYKMPEIESLAKDFIERSRRLPTEVILIAKALRHFGEHHFGVKILKSVLSEDTENLNATLLNILCIEYDLIPVDILVDCVRHGSKFSDLGSFHHRWLITYWMLEGFLGHVDSIEKTYKRGWQVLKELIDCGLLKTAEADHVIISQSVSTLGSNLSALMFYAANSSANHGMSILSGLKWNGVERNRMMNDRAKELINGQNFQKSISTVLLDGNCFGMEFLDEFLQSIKDIQVFAAFNPCFSSLPIPLTKMAKLKGLVLRGCDSLQNILHFVDMQHLTILEISGASSRVVIPDEFFEHVPFLQSLILSSLQIEELPPSLDDLTKLVRVVVRQCSELKFLPSFRKASQLEVLDFSGSTSLTGSADKILTSRELQTLNLSHSSIRSCPFLRDLQKLSSLLLSDCKYLHRLPSIPRDAHLRVLDISGSGIRDFTDDSFESCGLKIINCSQTDIICLPRNIGNVHYLYLRSCSKLKKLWSFESLTDLKELDVSGSSSLAYIEDNFFAHLTSLRILNLSETNLKSLPSLSGLCNLRKLLLSHCLSLKKLGDISFLTKLEVLDLSGCSSLTEIHCKSFEQMYKLEELRLSGISSLGDTGADFLKCMSELIILDLSDTGLQQLPSMSNLRKLEYLSLRNCSNLKEVPDLAALEKLESLDLSGTAVEDLPSFTNFCNLRHLRLKNCLKLKAFLHLELLKIIGDSANELPYDITKLTHLERLELPNMKIQGFDAEITKQPPRELNGQEWCISSWPDEAVVEGSDIGISVNSSLFLPLLERNPSLWQTSFMVFHFIVHPIEAQKRSIEKKLYKQELLVRDINFQRLQISNPQKRKRSLEIFGFRDTPTSIEPVLCRAEFVFLIENSCLRWLCDLGAENIKAMKACWIERCNNMESLFPQDDMEDAAKSVEDIKGKGKLEEVEHTAKRGCDLEVVWISNAVKLSSIYRGNLGHNGFEKLKCLHLEHCPNLLTLCSSSLLLENLEVLRIKFCDSFESLCGSDSPTLPKLRTLQLWELPQLKSVGCIALNLHNLLVGGCDMLPHVLSSAHFPENLEVLKVQSCENLETIFKDGESIFKDGESMCDRMSTSLHKLQLQDLPKLKNIGAILPALRDGSIRRCPLLDDHLFFWSKDDERPCSLYTSVRFTKTGEHWV